MNDEDLLSDLPRETPPPPALEQRIVSVLAIGAAAFPDELAAPSAVFDLILFAVGFLAGRLDLPRPTPARSFALILHESPDRAGDAHVDEYIAWSKSDFVLGGHELAPDSRVLGMARPTVGGFFIIAADSLDRATEIARTCPHVRYGGTIEVREILR